MISKDVNDGHPVSSLSPASWRPRSTAELLEAHRGTHRFRGRSRCRVRPWGVARQTGLRCSEQSRDERTRTKGSARKLPDENAADEPCSLVVWQPGRSRPSVAAASPSTPKGSRDGCRPRRATCFERLPFGPTRAAESSVGLMADTMSTPAGAGQILTLRSSPSSALQLRGYICRQSQFRRTSAPQERPGHSTVTLLARLRGLSTSVPRAQAVW